MFKRILVPLDGSMRAERALKVAARIARAAEGSIVLLQVVTAPNDYATSLYGPYLVQPVIPTEEVVERREARAKAYIESVSQSETLAGVNVETRIVVGAAVQAIDDVAREEDADLIVLCSHGDTGFKRWVLGSVAQGLTRTCHVPVLVLHEEGTVPDSAFPDPVRPLRSIVAEVALDGSEFAEAAILPAAKLVAALAAPVQGALVLTRVVPPSPQGHAPDTRELALHEAKTYLQQVCQKYAGVARQYNLSLRSAISTGKEVAGILIRSAEQGDTLEGNRLAGGCDLIAITTHGRGGLQRLAQGSVTERVLGATRLPLLVAHAPA